jgi:hypothetical protein
MNPAIRVVGKYIEYFKIKKHVLKFSCLDSTGQFAQMLFLKHPIMFALQVAECKEPHTVGEDLIKPCLVERIRLVHEEQHEKKVDQVSLSNCTVKGHILR